MTEWHGYMGVESLALNASQKLTLVNAIRALGMDNASAQPARRNHWRTRLDNNAVIFEAAFDTDNLSIAAFKARLANIFGVAVGTISHAVTTPTLGVLPSTVVTFTHLGTDYLRVSLFGGTSATWEQSNFEVLAYLAANAAEWESEL